MTFQSQILKALVTHTRTAPVEHSFDYPVTYFQFELSELSALNTALRGFSYNSRSLLCLRDEDYLDETEEPIFEKVRRLCAERKPDSKLSRVSLLTCPRVLNYVFNPVSFYTCYDSQGEIFCHIAEVSNTFKERYVYFLDINEAEQKNGKYTYRTPKSFHVSPFYEMQGEYEFEFGSAESCVDVKIRVNFRHSGAFVARLKGNLEPLTNKQLLLRGISTLRDVALIYPRILWEAYVLHHRKNINVYRKPTPPRANTFRFQKPSLLSKLGRKFFEQAFSCLSSGRLELRLPDGELLEFRGADPGLDIRVEVEHYRFFSAFLTGGLVGVAESFIRGEWTCNKLPQLIELLAENYAVVEESKSFSTFAAHSFSKLVHFMRRNTLLGSRRNISKHYDLGNEFFATFLDPTMTYSSAMFDSADDSLEQAQNHKLDSMVELADLQPEHHVLEIGCGWGSFAIRAVQRVGCKVTCLTLSREQHDYAQALVKRHGLEDSVTILLKDYREIQGQFDRVVSIEMIEAVGKNFLANYFSQIERLLTFDGIAVIQVITTREQRYAAYSRSVDFIQKHIFPGSHCPSFEAVISAMRRGSKFTLDETRTLGFDYAETLKIWRRNFLHSHEELEAQGFGEDFLRMWDFYLAYCEGGFRSKMINTFQLSFSRPGAKAARDRWERSQEDIGTFSEGERSYLH